jgi:acetyl esterase/lipase
MSTDRADDRGGLVPFDLDRRVDPGLADALAAKPRRMIERLDQVPRAREVMAATRPPSVLPATVAVADHHIDLDDGHRLMVRVYRPTGSTGPLPTLYWIHGGGLIVGEVAMNDGFCANAAAELDIAVASVEYRLAPDHPYPTPLEDCWAGLRWLADHADRLGVDPTGLAVGGGSAGGGLAAALALLARDRGGPDLSFQLLRYPMLDDRDTTPSSRAVDDPRVWNRSTNRLGWRAYLGDAAGGPDVPYHAAPARCPDPGGLPPAIITVGDLDLFIDEDLAYAQALGRAGVPVEVHVYPGAYHGAINDAPEADLTRRWQGDELAALGRALGRPGADQTG